MSRAKPAVVRFYVDADLLGLGRTLAGLRPDVTYPGDPGGTVHNRIRPACEVKSPETLDEDWIPVTAQRGSLVITRDRHIREKQAEIAAVRGSGARVVALFGKDAGTTWKQLEVVMCQWRAIEALLEQPGPFIYTATRTALTPIPLG